MNSSTPPPASVPPEPKGEKCPKCPEGRVHEVKDGDWQGETYRCDKCDHSYYINYDDIR